MNRDWVKGLGFATGSILAHDVWDEGHHGLNRALDRVEPIAFLLSIVRAILLLYHGFCLAFEEGWFLGAGTLKRPCIKCIAVSFLPLSKASTL